jgi:hypothetical protein
MTNGTLTSDDSLQRSVCGDAQTIVSQNQTATQDTAKCSTTGSANVAAIASGIAVPLGILLLASLVAVAVLLRQNRSLRKLSQQGSPAGGMAVSQLSPSHGEVEEGKGRGQTVYNYSPLNEMSDGRTPIESGGRSVVQELPARYTGR